MTGYAPTDPIHSNHEARNSYEINDIHFLILRQNWYEPPSVHDL